ncbi:MAG: hypothetical protein QCI82_00860 [Candidatus Thermoplasmatota archaeon]|nr:hypothetical protein [Candidatus Thermoplasmatota archaeon]
MKKKRIEPLRIRSDSFKHWIVKSILLFELERMGHRLEVELYIPGIGYCDVVDLTVGIQYEIDGNCSPKYRNEKAKKYLRPGIRDVIVIPIHKLPKDINEIRSYVAQYLVSD